MSHSGHRLTSTVFLATRELARQPLRALLSVVVAGFVVGLVMTFQGFRVGIYEDLARFPSGLPADRVVLEKGVRNLSLARSVLPQSARAEIESADNVISAHPLASIPVILDARDRRTPVQVIVYEDQGGPRTLVRGKPPETADGGNGLVMDERLAGFLEYAPGDTVTLFDYDYTLTGTTRETASPFAPYLYITYDGMLDMYFSQGSSVSPDAMIFLSALLVNLHNPEAGLPDDLRKEYAVWTPAELGAFDRRMGERMLGPALNLLVVLGFVIAVLTMGLLMYSKALGRQREYGVQKALGVPTGWMIGQLAVEGIVLVLLAMPVAVLLSLIIGEIMLAVSPLYRVEVMDAGVLLRSWAASTLACLAGSLMPMRRVAAADPAVVFRGADV